jgi:hypothetical protein
MQALRKVWFIYTGPVRAKIKPSQQLSIQTPMLNFILITWEASGIKNADAVRTSETSVDNHFTRQYIPEDNSEHKCMYTVQRTYTNQSMDVKFSLHL